MPNSLANRNRVKFEDTGIEKFPVSANPDLGRFAPDVLAPYRQPAPSVPTSTEPMVSFGGEPTRQSTVDKLMRKGKGVDSKGPLYPYGIAPPKK